MKRLLLILVFLIFIFPNSQVLAKSVPPCQTTDNIIQPPLITTKTTSGSGVSLTVDCPDIAACYNFKGTGLGGTEYNCYQTDTSPKTSTVCDPRLGNCSRGGGIKCAGGISTAIGCVPTEPKAFVEGLIKFLTLGSGGIAFLLMLLASLEMITAEGNAEAIKKAQEKFYSAIIGLLLIIFSVLLMQIIGVDVLGLPGFGPN